MIRHLQRPHPCQCLGSRVIYKAKITKARFSALVVVHDCLVTVHDVAHLPWYLTIPLSTFALSLFTLPIAIRSRKNQLKIAALQPILNAQIVSATSRLRRTSTPGSFPSDVTVASRKLRKTLHRKHHVNLLSILALPALKLPLWISFSLTIRSMAGSAIPYLTPLHMEESFRTEGVSWMSDLTLPDGTLLVPVTFGLLSLINVEVNALTTTTVNERKGRLRVTIERGMRLFSVLMIPVAAQMPAALCLYWASSAFSTLCQNIWLNRRYPTTTAVQQQQQQQQQQDDGGTVQTRLELPDIDNDDDIKTNQSDEKASRQGTRD